MGKFLHAIEEGDEKIGYLIIDMEIASGLDVSDGLLMDLVALRLAAGLAAVVFKVNLNLFTDTSDHSLESDIWPAISSESMIDAVVL